MKPTKINDRLSNGVKILILTTLLVFGVFRYVKFNPTISEAISLATTVRPENITELYFNNHTQLPNKIIPGQQYTFSFTIHNLENKDMEYPYVVYLQSDGKKTILYQDKISIKKDGYETIKETVGPFKYFRTKVVVELTGKNQIINYWLEK